MNGGECVIVMIVVAIIINQLSAVIAILMGVDEEFGYYIQGTCV